MSAGTGLHWKSEYGGELILTLLATTYLQRIDPFATQASDALFPRQQHAFADVGEARMLDHRRAYRWGHFADRLPDHLDDLPLFLHRDAEGGGDELLQGLARCLGLLAHEADARWVVLIAGIHADPTPLRSRHNRATFGAIVARSCLLVISGTRLFRSVV